MRIVVEARVLAGLDELCGVEPRRVLRFSEAEKATLRKAAAIADQARELWRETIGDLYDVDGESLDTELAMISIAVDEVADGIEISD